jgi:outer membrane protein assembly factor BamD (BamD/ComL family)
MSVLGIGGSALLGYLTQNLQGSKRQSQNEFQQLGQDLQTGNLSGAQSDLATLQQNSPFASASSTSRSSSSLSQVFHQLSQDLQTGNLSAAKQDYSTIQQDFQNLTALRQALGGHQRHHHAGSSASNSSAVSQLFSELGSALQSGNLSNAQQVYSSIQQDLLQYGADGGTPGSGAVSLNA